MKNKSKDVFEAIGVITAFAGLIFLVFISSPHWEFDNIQSIVIKELAKYKIIKEECINGI